MDEQRVRIRGRVLGSADPALQAALAAAYENAERPVCLCCVPGVEMYVARHRQFVLKRLPATGPQHHPSCPSFELPARHSGLGELMGEAVTEPEPGSFELQVSFPWVRRSGSALTTSGMSGEQAQDVAEVAALPQRMSLRALLHFLFQTAGFNRWTPAMQGKRNQAVLHKYLMQAARAIFIQGVCLADRLYVPEAFSESGREEAARRRRLKLSILQPRGGRHPLALVVGEFKACEVHDPGTRRIWVRHAPDAPLLVASRTWARLERSFKALLEAPHADVSERPRLVMAALIRARRENTYEVDAASLMLTSNDWIPLEGIHELTLVHALIEQQRRFIKPLRYDARCAAAFANALLLDVGSVPVALHVSSPFMSERERRVKDKAVGADPKAWWWDLSEAMPGLPAGSE